ncbi:unnamed protein product [Cunninghamella blakesleeana]
MRLNKKIFHPKTKDSNDLISYHFKEQSKIQQKLNSKSSISNHSHISQTNQDDPYLRVKANGAIVMNRSRSYTSLADHWLNDKDLDDLDHDTNDGYDDDNDDSTMMDDLDDDHYHTDIEIKTKRNKYNHNRKKYIKQKSHYIEEEEEEEENHHHNDVELDNFSFSSTLSSHSYKDQRKDSTTSTNSSTSTSSSTSHHLPQFDSFLTSSPIRIRPSFSTLPPFSSYSYTTSSSFSSSSTDSSSLTSTHLKTTLKNPPQQHSSSSTENDLLLSVPPLLPPKDIAPLDSQHMYRSSSLPSQSPTLPTYHLTYERKLDILLEEMDSVQQENVTMMKNYQLLLDQYNLLKTQLIDKDRYVQSLQLQLENNPI